MKNIPIINYGHIYDYIICPKLYYWKYIKNYKGIFPDQEQSIIGNKLHKAINWHFNELNIPDTYFEYPEKLKLLWKNYLNSKYAIIPDKTNLKSECLFQLPLYINNTQVIFIVRIDRLIIEENKVLILDWKTSKDIENNLKNEFQMKFYTFCLSHTLPKILKDKKIDYFETNLVYLSLNKTVQNKWYINDLEVITEEIIDITRKIIQEEYIENPIKISFCKLCKFKNLCITPLIKM